MIRPIRAAIVIVPAIILSVTAIMSGSGEPASQEQAGIRSAGVSADCSFLKDPEEFLYSAERHHLEISDRTKTVAAYLQPIGAHSSANGGTRRRIERRNLIDNHIFGRMEAAGIQPAPVVSDSEFLRRVTLDLTGRIPSMDDVERFLSDPNPGKRDDLVDLLIGSPEFVDKWTMFLGDLFKVNANASNIVLYPQGRDAMVAYLRDAVRSNKPYDRIATELISGKGNNLYQGEANWAASGFVEGPVQDTYDSEAAMTASQFLGINVVDCLLCHDGLRHVDTLNLWAKDRKRVEMWRFAAFFSRMTIERSVASLSPSYTKATVSDNDSGTYPLNTTIGNRVARKPINGLQAAYPAYPFTQEVPEPGQNYRIALAAYVTNDPQFARAIVNYIWEKLMVVAFVTPSNAFDPARLDPDNPPPAPWTLQPTNPELLNALGEWLRDNGYDLRKLMALITKSNAYQLSSSYPEGWKAEYVSYYARHYPRRLDAEEIHDAIVKATGILPSYVLDYAGSLNPLPAVSWAMQFPDTREPRTNNAVAQFLNAFNRGDRDLVPRNKAGSVMLGLNLMNNAFVNQRIHATNNGSMVQRLLASTADSHLIAEQLFVTTLGRYPTEGEMEAALDTMKQIGNTSGAEALQWALLNKLDFIHNY